MFYFDDNLQFWEVYVYYVDDFVGEFFEIEEMVLWWFVLLDILYDKMWQDDLIWYFVFLFGGYFKGEFYFYNMYILVFYVLYIVEKLDIV